MDSFIVIVCVLFSFEDKKDLKSCGWQREMEESNGVFIVIQRCCLLRRTSRNYSDYPDYVRILFYSGSPEIHRLFDDAFVWSGWDRSIHTYIALIDMDQYGHVTEYISVYSLCMYSVHCLYTPYYEAGQMDTYIPYHPSLLGTYVRIPQTPAQPSKPAAADPKAKRGEKQKKWFGVLRVDGVIVDTQSGMLGYARLLVTCCV